MSNLQSYKSNTVIHPGKTLEETLDFLNLSIKQLSEKTGITTKHISNIVNGKASITPETSLKLERVVSVSASFWDNLEKNYQSSLARIEQKEKIKEEFTELINFKETYKELVSKNILPKFIWTESNFEIITSNLLDFFGIASFQYKHQLDSVVYRRYKGVDINYNTIGAIIRLGEKKAEKISTMIYNESLLKETLPQIKKLSLLKYTEYMPKLEKILADLGIVLVCIPGFKNTGVQGVSKWISKDKAMIILKSSGQTKETGFNEDKFWFNLYHELGHIILHGKKQTFIDLKDEPDSKEEREANDFASNQLMPDFKETDLDKYKSNGFIDAKKAVEGESIRYSISKSIIAGQLSYLYSSRQTNVYLVLSKYKNMIQYSNCI